MEERTFIKERKNNSIIVFLVMAIIISFISSAITYTLMKESDDQTVVKYDGNEQSLTRNIEIESVENPVVAIAKKVGPSAVGINIESNEQNTYSLFGIGESSGSGIIYSEDGYILTNYHVIESAIDSSNVEIKVTFNDDSSVNAAIVGVDETTDLAVLKVEKEGLVAAEMGKSEVVEVGELAVAIGNPLGQEFAGSVTVGYISALNREITTDGRTYKLIQTDAAINPGNSGGALVNSLGQVIGINTAKIDASNVEGLGFAIPIDIAVPVVDELIKNGKIVRPFIGIMGLDLSEEQAEYYELVEGVLVKQIIDDTPASKSGIEVDDVIVKVDDKDIKTMDALNEYKNTKEIGDTITLKIYRVDKYIDVEIILEEMK